jgi:hypothetical protein
MLFIVFLDVPLAIPCVCIVWLQLAMVLRLLLGNHWSSVSCVIFAVVPLRSRPTLRLLKLIMPNSFLHFAASNQFGCLPHSVWLDISSSVWGFSFLFLGSHDTTQTSAAWRLVGRARERFAERAPKKTPVRQARDTCAAPGMRRASFGGLERLTSWLVLFAHERLILLPRLLLMLFVFRFSVLFVMMCFLLLHAGQTQPHPRQTPARP